MEILRARRPVMAGRPENPTVASLTQQGALLDYELRHSLPDFETPHQVAGPRGLVVIATGFWARGPPPARSPKYHHPSQCSTPPQNRSEIAPAKAPRYRANKEQDDEEEPANRRQ